MSASWVDFENQLKIRRVPTTVLDCFPLVPPQTLSVLCQPVKLPANTGVVLSLSTRNSGISSGYQRSAKVSVALKSLSPDVQYVKLKRSGRTNLQLTTFLCIFLYIFLCIFLSVRLNRDLRNVFLDLMILSLPKKFVMRSHDSVMLFQKSCGHLQSLTFTPSLNGRKKLI